ncbi:MAG TPA: trypsin-like peptidase domain-containing protein [Tepidisphaeraceae bacterium]
MSFRCTAPAGRVVVVAFIFLVSIVRAGSPADFATPADNTSTVELTNLQSQFRAVADRVAPGVVAISAACSTDDADDAIRNDDINTEKLATMLEHTNRTVGTGFVIDADGYLLTNEHVISECNEIWITTDDHKVYPAIVVGSDPRADLAVLKIPAHHLTPVKFAAAQSVQRGMWTIAMGNPYGLAALGEMSMSVGVVSATDRSLPKLASKENRYYADLIQTTAEINPGNSGGPLFDLDGNVIGISTAVILPQKSTNGIGFALPITPELLAKVNDLKAGREISYAYLGVMVKTPTPRQKAEANVTDGVLVDLVEKDSPADASLLDNDMILQLGDQPIHDSDQFIRLIGEASITQPTHLVISRGSKTLPIDIKLRQRELPSIAINRTNQRIHWRGMTLGPIPQNSTHLDHGLLVLSIDPDNPLTKQGVAIGSVIGSVAGRMLHSVFDLQDILSQTPAEKCNLQILPAGNSKVAIVSGQ